MILKFSFHHIISHQKVTVVKGILMSNKVINKKNSKNIKTGRALTETLQDKKYIRCSI